MSDNLGPVEIEFTIPDSFGKEADAAIKKMASLTDAAKNAPDQVKAAIADQKEFVKAIQTDIKELEKSLKTLDAGPVKDEVTSALAGSKQALTAEILNLKDLELAYDQAKGGNQRLSFQLRDMQEQLIRMRLAGKQRTAEYREMELAAAALADEIADVRQVTKNLADDQQAFRGFADGVTGLTGAFAAAGGAVALFAGENENLQKIQTKVQGLMAITIGLQQVSTSLNKDSAFMTVTVAKAKQLWATAEKSLTTALWGSNVAAKALMATMTLGVAIAIPALIALYDRLVQKQEAAVAAQKEAMRITTEANIEAGKARIEIDQMIRKLETFKGSKEAEKRTLKEVNDAYGDTFGTYKTLAEWLDVLKTKATDYVKVMFLQSKATRQVDKAINYDTQAQQIAAQPLTDFVDMKDVDENTNFWGKVDEEKLKKIAEERRLAQVNLAKSRKELALKEADLVKIELQALENASGINTTAGDAKGAKDKTAATYAQKLAEVKKFYELYKTAIELGQNEAAAIFKKQLPDAANYQQYVNQELIKANASGNKEKVAALIPEQKELSAALKELLGEYQTYSDQRTAIEQKYNEKITQLAAAGYDEKAKVAEAARDKELKALDDSQPLAKLVEKYKDYRKQIEQITIDSNKEIEQLTAAGYTDEAKLAQLERDKAINKLILENEKEKIENIAEMGKAELKAYIEKIKIKIELLKAEGKSVEELEKTYAQAQLALSAQRFDDAAKILGSMTQAAHVLNEEFGRLVGLASNLAGNLSTAIEGFKKGGADAAAGFGTVLSIVATVADELDKQWGVQARIAKIEEAREKYNKGLIIKIENINREIEKQLKLMDRVNGTNKADEFTKSLELINQKSAETRASLDGMQFEFLPAPDEIDQKIDMAFIRHFTGLTDDYEAINAAFEKGWISNEQANIARDYVATLEGLNDQYYELSQQEIEFLTQTNAVQLADQLADALVNAAMEGTDAMEAWGDVTDQVLQNAIKNALKMKLLSGPIEDAVAQLAQDMDGGLSPEEQAAFRASMEAAGRNYTEALEQFPDLFGDTSQEAQDRITQRNGFGSMNQETASALLGQFTALRMSSARVADILADERNARASMRQSLEAIAENTSYCRKLEDIDKTLKSLETDGIKVR